MLAEANPSLQDADLPGIKYIREQVVETKGCQQRAIVRRLNFCQWTDAESPWISGEVWRGAQRDFDWQDLRGRRAVAGLDLSSTTDLTGLVFLWSLSRLVNRGFWCRSLGCLTWNCNARPIQTECRTSSGRPKGISTLPRSGNQ